ncbi:MAG: hypothetical protein A2293_12045 [Elusimicrobia bacterium RIFOXYB2_FULL_49_7]|nr:MAG: hypothetical protein A2293_12045 [Elusimicrobia bacterium RIFOXYB2_FULL_49_7]
MIFAVYTLCGLAIVKVLLDVALGELYAPYSVAVETLIFFSIFFMIIRTFLKVREGRRETLLRRINELNQQLTDSKQDKQ